MLKALRDEKEKNGEQSNGGLEGLGDLENDLASLRDTEEVKSEIEQQPKLENKDSEIVNNQI